LKLTSTATKLIKESVVVQQQYNYSLEKRRNLSLPRLCLRPGSSLDIIASQILLNGVVTLRSHDVDPMLPLRHPDFCSRPFVPIPEACKTEKKKRKLRQERSSDEMEIRSESPPAFKQIGDSSPNAQKNTRHRKTTKPKKPLSLSQKSLR
jgi:hypothetical protein